MTGLHIHAQMPQTQVPGTKATRMPALHNHPRSRLALAFKPLTCNNAHCSELCPDTGCINFALLAAVFALSHKGYDAV